MLSLRREYIRFSIALIFLLGCFGVYLYAFQEVKTRNQSVSELTAKVSDATTKNTTHRSLAQVVEQTKQEKEKLDSYFVEADDVALFLEKIEKYSDYTSAKIKFTTVDFDKKSGALLLVLNIEGTFQQIYRTIRMLEATPYVFQFSRVSVSRSTSSVVETVSSVEGGENIPSGPVLSQQWRADVSIRLLSFIPNTP